MQPARVSVLMEFAWCEAHPSFAEGLISSNRVWRDRQVMTSDGRLVAMCIMLSAAPVDANTTCVRPSVGDPLADRTV